MSDAMARLLAAGLTVLGMLIVAYITHRLTLARERSRTGDIGGSGESDESGKVEDFIKNVHSPIIRLTHEVAALIEDTWQNNWNPDMGLEWKKVKDEKFRALMIKTGRISEILQSVLDLITPYLAALPDSLSEKLSTELAGIVTDLKVLETMQKEKSEHPSNTFNRMKNLLPLLEEVRKQFKPESYRKLIDSCRKI